MEIDQCICELLRPGKSHLFRHRAVPLQRLKKILPRDVLHDCIDAVFILQEIIHLGKEAVAEGLQEIYLRPDIHKAPDIVADLLDDNICLQSAVIGEIDHSASPRADPLPDHISIVQNRTSGDHTFLPELRLIFFPHARVHFLFSGRCSCSVDKQKNKGKDRQGDPREEYCRSRCDLCHRIHTFISTRPRRIVLPLYSSCISAIRWLST